MSHGDVTKISLRFVAFPKAAAGQQPGQRRAQEHQHPSVMPADSTEMTSGSRSPAPVCALAMSPGDMRANSRSALQLVGKQGRVVIVNAHSLPPGTPRKP